MHKRGLTVTVANLKGTETKQMPQTLTDSFKREWGEFANIITRSRSCHAAVGRWQPTNVNASAARNARFKVGVRLYQAAKTPAQKKRALKMMVDNWPD